MERLSLWSSVQLAGGAMTINDLAMAAEYSSIASAYCPASYAALPSPLSAAESSLIIDLEQALVATEAIDTMHMHNEAARGDEESPRVCSTLRRGVFTVFEEHSGSSSSTCTSTIFKT